MKTFFIKWYSQWRELLKEKNFRISLLVGIFLLFTALIVMNLAASYKETVIVQPVGDLILDRLPPLDLNISFTYGFFLIITLIVLYPLFFKPQLGPFTAKTMAAFLIIRAFFITLTHIGAPKGFLLPAWGGDPDSALRLFYVNDLFFSGHVGLPFLAALLFWENKFMRWFMIIMSFVQALTVLFLRVHYSIDVFSAFFITYAIYIVSDKIFNKLNLSFHNIVLRIEEKMGIKSSH
ncbi:hypothetical protein HYW83_02620 [Candidatus Peregrinibacteria bacterium]|nr:hypothetical protein [Candidatus Peregrinibacteria bacterium]